MAEARSAPRTGPPTPEAEPLSAREPDYQVLADILRLQLQSALEAGDKAAARKLRIEYENLLEGWRAQVELRRAFPPHRELEELPRVGSDKRRHVGLLLELAREKLPWSPTDDLLYANVLYALEEYQHALEILDPLQGLVPDEARLHRKRGCCFAELEMWQLSKRAFRRSLSLEADHPVALRGLGLALIRSGDPDQALVPLRRALEANPRDTEAMFLMGEAHGMLDQPREASSWYRKALRLDPQDQRFLYRHTRTLLELGSRDMAIEALDLLFDAGALGGDEICRVSRSVPAPPVRAPEPSLEDPAATGPPRPFPRRSRRSRRHGIGPWVWIGLAALALVALTTSIVLRG